MINISTKKQQLEFSYKEIFLNTDTSLPKQKTQVTEMGRYHKHWKYHIHGERGFTTKRYFDLLKWKQNSGKRNFVSHPKEILMEMTKNVGKVNGNIIMSSGSECNNSGNFLQMCF